MRFIYGDNGSISEFTSKVVNYKVDEYTFSYVAGQDYIYIGSDLPFNHFYIKMGSVVNAITSVMSIQYWDGQDWEDVAEVVDETEALSKSGFVTFTPDKRKQWQMESTNDQGNTIADLSSVKIYDMYWILISFSTNLTANTGIKWIGNIFSDDYDLYSEFPIFNSSALKTAFESGKTDWQEQHIKAASVVIKDLKEKNIIQNAGNILKKEEFNLAAVSKTAQIIFGALGDDYTDDYISAKTEYGERIKNSKYSVDTNNNAILDVKEKDNQVGFMAR